MTNCPHCDAPLKPAATFCLTCDRPVVAETSRLSVAEPVHVEVGRPVVAVAAIAGAAVLLAASAWGGIAYIHHEQHHSTDLVLDDVKQGTTFLVDAEGGRSGDCRKASKVLLGPAKDVRAECALIFGKDPGARVTSISVGTPHLEGETGTVPVHLTVTDARGSRTIDHVADVQRAKREWRMTWDGRPEI